MVILMKKIYAFYKVKIASEAEKEKQNLPQKMLTDWLQISYTCYLALTSPPKKNQALVSQFFRNHGVPCTPYFVITEHSKTLERPWALNITTTLPNLVTPRTLNWVLAQNKVTPIGVITSWVTLSLVTSVVNQPKWIHLKFGHPKCIYPNLGHILVCNPERFTPSLI